MLFTRWLPSGAFVLLLTIGSAGPAAAQTHRSHWGVSASFVPKWEVPEQLGLAFEAEPVEMTGSEFRIGVVRGRDLSGEWGISYIRKRIDTGSTLGEIGEECAFGACAPSGEVYRYRDSYIEGVLFHKFVPFGTIKRRLQIGLLFGGGIGRFEGEVDAEYHSAAFQSDGTQTTIIPFVTTETLPAKDAFAIPVVPLGDLQVAVAAIVAPGVKIRASGGLSFPGYHAFSVTGSILFGAR